MKTTRRRCEFIFLLYFCATIPEIFGESHPLAAIYENTGRILNENPSIREERQITFRNTFQDIPESLHKSVFMNRSNETFPGPKYYVVLSDVQSSTLSNLLDILSKDGRIYFPPRVNVLDRIDDPNRNGITSPLNTNEIHSNIVRGRSINSRVSGFSHESKISDPSLFEITPPTNEFEHPIVSARSIDSQLPTFSSTTKVGKSLLSAKIFNDPIISEIPEVLNTPTNENFKFFQKSGDNDQFTNFNFPTRKVKFIKSKLDNSVKKRESFDEVLLTFQFPQKSVGKNNEIAFRPGKNLSKREENSEISVQGELGLIPDNYIFNQSRPDFLSFIKRRSKNFISKNEDRVGVADNENILPEKPRPTIGKLVDMWKKMNNRYRKRLVTPPASLVQRKSPKKSLRSPSLPSKLELEFNSFDKPNSQNDNIEVKQKKSLQIQTQEASHRQEKRLKSIAEFSTEPNDFIVESLNEEDRFIDNEIRGREISNFNIDDTFYSRVPKIPQTSFSCSHAGYFADVEVQCQVFHVCWGRRKASFVCPAGTAFSQKLQVCAWRQHVQCNYR